MIERPSNKKAMPWSHMIPIMVIAWLAAQTVVKLLCKILPKWWDVAMGLPAYIVTMMLVIVFFTNRYYERNK